MNAHLLPSSSSPITTSWIHDRRRGGTKLRLRNVTPASLVDDLFPAATSVDTLQPSSSSQSSPRISGLKLKDVATQSPASVSRTPSITIALCNLLEDIISNFIDDPAAYSPSVDPHHALAGNFAPVDELPPTPCQIVRGRIPCALNGGAYLRNGPNPRRLPRGPHHLFDGDGMLHSLLFSPSPLNDDGGVAASFCSRYVLTYKYVQECKTGVIFPRYFAGFSGVGGLARCVVAILRVLTGQMNPLRGIGLANTSLAFFGGCLFALAESDLPYAIRLSPSSGDIATLGRWNSKGELSMNMTAHPKKDPDTGEVFAFRWGPMFPFITYFHFDAEGNKQPDVPFFSVKRPSFIHDFGITKNFAIFCDTQFVVQPLEMVFKGGSPVAADTEKVPRVGLLPRYAHSDSNMKWYDVPGFNPMHIINVWEEDGGGAVVVVAPNVLSVQNALDRMDLVTTCVEMVRIDKETGAVLRTLLSARNLEFGVINPLYQGRCNRYAYMGLGGPLPKVGGVVKLDYLQGQKKGSGDCVVACRMYGPGRFGGEPFFVAAPDEGAEEDDGYLVTYVHDENTGESFFMVMDARSPELEVVTEILLPGRVPYGFHGLFVSEVEIRGQRP